MALVHTSHISYLLFVCFPPFFSSFGISSSSSSLFLDYNIKPADLIWTPCWRNGNKSDRMRRNEAAHFLLLLL